VFSTIAGSAAFAAAFGDSNKLVLGVIAFVVGATAAGVTVADHAWQLTNLLHDQRSGRPTRHFLTPNAAQIDDGRAALLVRDVHRRRYEGDDLSRRADG
jgi:hypothetical protein